MQDHEVINILQNQLQFSSKTIPNIRIFVDELLQANKKHNFISKSTENNIKICLFSLSEASIQPSTSPSLGL